MLEIRLSAGDPMHSREGQRWREFDVSRKVTVTVSFVIDAERLRLKEQKTKSGTCYVNFKHGVLLTRAVLKDLIAQGLLTLHVHDHPRKTPQAKAPVVRRRARSSPTVQQIAAAAVR